MKCRGLLIIRLVLCALALVGSREVALAQDNLTMSAPPELRASGLLRHVLPRFSLKTQIRFDSVDTGGDLAFLPEGSEGRPAFTLGGVTYALVASDPEEPRTRRFLDWMKSDVGERTLLSFNKDGRPVVSLPDDTVVEVAREAPTGNVLEGEKLALFHCGRCHVVSAKNRMAGIGSTPSFAVLRTLPDWQDRFDAFFTLNPHPSFTQIPDVTEPFDPMRPPMIAPIELSLEDVAAITAFAATISKSDLGSADIAK